MSDLPNLGKFCNPIPQLTVFGFRQLKEDGKYENSHYITNIPDYMRLSVDVTLTGMWRYYHKRASIESSIKTERNILHTAHKRGRKFYSSWGYLILAAIAYNLLYLLRDMFFSTTPEDDVGMKDFVRDAIDIPCEIKTKKVRGKAIRQVSLVLDQPVC
jgi:Transposase DDE domain